MSDAAAAIDTSEQIAFLRKQLEAQTKSFRRSRKFYENWAFGFRIGRVFVGGLTTVLLGIKKYFPHSEEDLTLVAFLVSACVPIAVAIESFYDYRRAWIRSNVVLMALYGVSDELEFKSARGMVAPDEAQLLFGKFEAALKGSNDEWSKDHVSALNADKAAEKKAEKT